MKALSLSDQIELTLKYQPDKFQDVVKLYSQPLTNETLNPHTGLFDYFLKDGKRFYFNELDIDVLRPDYLKLVDDFIFYAAKSGVECYWKPEIIEKYFK